VTMPRMRRSVVILTDATPLYAIPRRERNDENVTGSGWFTPDLTKIPARRSHRG
jgi:hypothetical protein